MSYQALMEELLERTGASRTTLRVDDQPGKEYPVKAEALAPGVNSIAGDETIPDMVARIYDGLDMDKAIAFREQTGNPRQWSGLWTS